MKMFSGHIAAVLRQALNTFPSHSASELFHANLELLRTLLNQTKPHDVNILMRTPLWQQPNHEESVSYIDIFENESISMGIFVLKPNTKLPLHNHPDMHGLIKVVAGEIKVTSYSLNTDRTRLIDAAVPPPLNPLKQLTVERCDEVVMDSHTDSCLLGPENRNIHEVESVGAEPAAFIDVLSPPYSDAGERKCRYYRILREISSGVFRLQEV